MDQGRSGPPDPGGANQQFPPLPSARSQESSKNNSALQSLLSVQKQTSPPAIGGSSGSSRQPETGKQKTSLDIQSLDAALPRAPSATAKELFGRLQQRMREKAAAAHAASTDDASSGNKRAAPESEGDNRPSKRLTTGLPVKAPYRAIPRTSSQRCIVWYDFGMPALQPLFGSLQKTTGVSIKVNLVAGDTGGLSVILNMGVNKGDVSEAVSNQQHKVSRFQLVWNLDVETDWGFRVHQFDHTSLDENEEALGEAGNIIKKDMKGNLTGIKLIDMKVNGFQVASPYESQYWQRLNTGSKAQRSVNVGVTFLHSLAQVRCPLIHFKIWFYCPIPDWDRACGSVFKRYVDERHASQGAAGSYVSSEPSRARGDDPWPGMYDEPPEDEDDPWLDIPDPDTGR